MEEVAGFGYEYPKFGSRVSRVSAKTAYHASYTRSSMGGVLMAEVQQAEKARNRSKSPWSDGGTVMPRKLQRVSVYQGEIADRQRSMVCVMMCGNWISLLVVDLPWWLLFVCLFVCLLFFFSFQDLAGIDRWRRVTVGKDKCIFAFVIHLVLVFCFPTGPLGRLSTMQPSGM